MNAGLVKAGYWNGTAVSKLTNQELSEYIDACAGQLMEMNEKATAAGREAPFPHPRIDAMKYELIPTAGGRMLVKQRKTPLVDEFSSHDAVAVAVITPGAAGFDRTFRRGKYNDAADRLVDQDAASVELGELQIVDLNG